MNDTWCFLQCIFLVIVNVLKMGILNVRRYSFLKIAPSGVGRARCELGMEAGVDLEPEYGGLT